MKNNLKILINQKLFEIFSITVLQIKKFNFMKKLFFFF